MEKPLTTNLVIGLGQIGSAIQKILECDGFDISKESPLSLSAYDVIHVCIPYSESFIDSVKSYQMLFNPKLTIIHSTVPVGTSRKLGAVHSPCRGIHPNLEEGIRTFTKFFGGEQAPEAAAIFYSKEIPVHVTLSPENTEALKLWDTTIYGLNIVLEKEIYKYCKDNDVDFDIVYRLANETYNEGYQKLGHPQYVKYILKHSEGKIGGHCVIPNLPLLKGTIPEIIQKYNEKL